eukprot:NODE_1308_length_971_cov_520.396963_g1005_i0.p1 GENE.NODE_1308_length_971_cov_520.396963_g1005_i0~~NODE_1308_length_971_cov_520.396963_g1005_i0.p1  ORF type:complete len:236 (-),score=51.48 NODE_1308_length_971_cov_520.396963_g1005_i0:184-891(-)
MAPNFWYRAITVSCVGWSGAYFYYMNQVQRGPRVIISGGPASGKGTQCEMLSKKFGCKHISTGDCLRDHVKRGTPLGLEAKAAMDKGDLVSDDLVMGICKEEVDKAGRAGYLLDGVPRTKGQVEAMKKAGIDPSLFILLEVPDEVLIERSVGRRIHKETGKAYHLKFFPPPADIAKDCYQRSDDTEEKMKNRLKQYHHNVSEVQGSFADRTIRLDGNRNKNTVFQELCEQFEKIL